MSTIDNDDEFGDDAWGDDDIEQVIEQSATPVAGHSGITHEESFENVDVQVPTDAQAIHTWIYPTNLPIRDYQLNITQAAISKNVLVCLPTGLGKTMIAAVVIYNYHRWFPTGKIVFIAPTKPLVTQQIQACSQVTGLGNEHCVELTGSINADARAELWYRKKVFFCTGQTVQNDLRNGICPGSQIVLVVVDEAHRATGNHAFAATIQALFKQTSHCRILALTATPGSQRRVVQEIVDKLKINAIESRRNDSIDIVKYTQHSKKEEVVVEPGEHLEKIAGLLIKLSRRFLERLGGLGIRVSEDLSRVSAYFLIKSRQTFRVTHPVADARRMMAEGLFGVTQKLASAYSMLMSHGIGSFVRIMSEFESEVQGGGGSKAKKELVFDPDFKEAMDKGREVLEAPDKRSHPKIDRLAAIVLEHFATVDDPSSKVMVFSQYRESVEEIFAVLKENEPMIRPSIFIGQQTKALTKGLKQSEQLEIVQSFRSGRFNTLVSTSIGEEGLDIGEVDLIVSFDVQKSPIRLLQRMGRTGRKREGRVVNLLTKGKEEEDYHFSLSTYKRVQTMIESSGLMFKRPYRMIPTQPELVKEHIDVSSTYSHQSKPVKKRKSTDVDAPSPKPKKSRKSKSQSQTRDSMAGSFQTAAALASSSLTQVPSLAGYSYIAASENETLRQIRYSFGHNLPDSHPDAVTSTIGHSDITHAYRSLLRSFDDSSGGATSTSGSRRNVVDLSETPAFANGKSESHPGGFVRKSGLVRSKSGWVPKSQVYQLDESSSQSGFLLPSLPSTPELPPHMGTAGSSLDSEIVIKPEIDRDSIQEISSGFSPPLCSTSRKKPKGDVTKPSPASTTKRRGLALEALESPSDDSQKGFLSRPLSPVIEKTRRKSAKRGLLVSSDESETEDMPPPTKKVKPSKKKEKKGKITNRKLAMTQAAGAGGRDDDTEENWFDTSLVQFIDDGSGSVGSVAGAPVQDVKFSQAPERPVWLQNLDKKVNLMESNAAKVDVDLTMSDHMSNDFTISLEGGEGITWSMFREAFQHEWL